MSELTTLRAFELACQQKYAEAAREAGCTLDLLKYCSYDSDDANDGIMACHYIAQHGTVADVHAWSAHAGKMAFKQHRHSRNDDLAPYPLCCAVGRDVAVFEAVLQHSDSTHIVDYAAEWCVRLNYTAGLDVLRPRLEFEYQMHGPGVNHGRSWQENLLFDTAHLKEITPLHATLLKEISCTWHVARCAMAEGNLALVAATGHGKKAEQLFAEVFQGSLVKFAWRQYAEQRQMVNVAYTLAANWGVWELPEDLMAPATLAAFRCGQAKGRTLLLMCCAKRRKVFLPPELYELVLDALLSIFK